MRPGEQRDEQQTSRRGREIEDDTRRQATEEKEKEKRRRKMSIRENPWRAWREMGGLGEQGRGWSVADIIVREGVTTLFFGGPDVMRGRRDWTYSPLLPLFPSSP